MSTTNTAKSPDNALKPIFQLALIIISSAILSSAIYFDISRYSFPDPPPHINITTPEQLKAFGGFPDIIKAGLFIDEYQTFDTIDNNFIFTGIVWFLFDPGDISLETLEQFSFIRGQILYRSAPDSKMINGQLLVRYNVRVQFTSSLDYHRFPLDNHRLYLTLSHPALSPGEINFASTDREFVIKPDTQQLGWLRVDKDVQIGYVEANLDPHDPQKTNRHPAVLFSIDYSRTSIRYMLSILLPLLMIFYLMMFSFSVEDNYAIRLTVGGITATLAYRFVIERISPEAAYFMLSDYLFFLFLMASLSIFFANIVDLFIVKTSLLQRTIIAIALHAGVVGTGVYLIVGA